MVHKPRPILSGPQPLSETHHFLKLIYLFFYRILTLISEWGQFFLRILNLIRILNWILELKNDDNEEITEELAMEPKRIIHFFFKKNLRLLAKFCPRKNRTLKIKLRKRNIVFRLKSDFSQIFFLRILTLISELKNRRYRSGLVRKRIKAIKTNNKPRTKTNYRFSLKNLRLKSEFCLFSEFLF